MREIKFRAWIPKDKLMLYEEDIRGSRDMLLWGYSWLKDGGFCNAVPMQYTGLKDKNGKECYWDDWVTDGVNPKFLVTPDYHLLARLSEIEFEIVGNKYEVE